MKERLRVLITGATGSAGRHLCELAIGNGAEVWGLARGRHFPAGVAAFSGDVASPGVAAECLEKCRPHRIFHLAAAVHGSAPASPEEMFRTNVGGTFHLLEAARRLAPEAWILVTGSSGIYAAPDDPAAPVNESAPWAPRSPYAASKAAQDVLAAEFGAAAGLKIVRTRTFNQTGPHEPKNLVCATLARRIAMLEPSDRPRLLDVRDLEAARDFCDVRDIVKAYWLLLEHGRPGVAYNVCSGHATTIREIVSLLASQAEAGGIVINALPSDASSLRRQVGDYSLLHKHTGWTPQIPLAQSMADLLAEWRGRLAAGAQ